MFYADTIFVNGNIITMDSKLPRAQAVAIKDGKFVAVGTNNQILPYLAENTEKIDLNGKFVVPGLIDSHVHGAALGRYLSQINLRGTKSIGEIQDKVEKETKEKTKGKWILGRGWDQDRLAEHRYPSRFDLDQVAPDHPVFLLRVCGHLGVVNSKALQLAGITKETDSPKGGRIDRELRTGEPHGILREKALDLIYNVLPEYDKDELTNQCLLACRTMVQEGLTTAHWIVRSTKEIQVLQKLRTQNMLPLRIYLLIPVKYLDHILELGLHTGFGDDRIKIGGVKILLDGSLGGRTAALKKPYKDAPETKGLMLYSRKHIEELVERAHKGGLQLAIHAIGDRAIGAVLDILENTLKKTGERHRRHRLEHASVLTPKLIEKMKDLNVIVSVQPSFTVSDFWISDRLGEARAKLTYPFKSILVKGVTMIGGSDAPIDPVSPIKGIWASVTRETLPQERLTVDDALRLYTRNGAYGSFEENLKGSIENGKLADLVVLSQDPYKTAPQRIKEIQVVMTVVNGKIVFTK